MQRRDGGGLEFCLIDPAAVLGAVWSAGRSTSIEVGKKLLEAAMPACPHGVALA
jgi:dihydroflavonol-4-reductase